MTVSQMEEAKNAEKFLPPRGSLQVFVVPPGVLGVLAVTHVPQLDAKPSDANAKPNARTPEAGPAVPEVVPRPPASLRSRTPYGSGTGQYPSGTVVVLAGTLPAAPHDGDGALGGLSGGGRHGSTMVPMGLGSTILSTCGIPLS